MKARIQSTSIVLTLDMSREEAIILRALVGKLSGVKAAEISQCAGHYTLFADMLHELHEQLSLALE